MQELQFRRELRAEPQQFRSEFRLLASDPARSKHQEVGHKKEQISFPPPRHHGSKPPSALCHLQGVHLRGPRFEGPIKPPKTGALLRLGLLKILRIL